MGRAFEYRRAAKEKRWATILSRIEMNGTTKVFLITLGEQRIKLTEKLKLILEGK